MLYQLDPFTGEQDPIEIKENRKVVVRFIVRDKGEEDFHDAGKVRFIANEAYYSSKSLQETDFLYAAHNLLVFSGAAYQALHEIVREDLVFYPCEVIFNEEVFDFYIGKIVTQKPIVNTEKSTYRSLTDGSKTLLGTVYRDDLEEDFYLAKDVGRNYRYAATQKFVDLVKATGLKIGGMAHPTDPQQLIIK